MARDDCDGDKPHAFVEIEYEGDPDDPHAWTTYECQRCGEINAVWPS